MNRLNLSGEGDEDCARSFPADFGLFSAFTAAAARTPVVESVQAPAWVSAGIVACRCCAGMQLDNRTVW